MLLMRLLDHFQDLHPGLVPLRAGLGDVEQPSSLLVEGRQLGFASEPTQPQVDALAVRPGRQLFLAVPGAVMRIPRAVLAAELGALRAELTAVLPAFAAFISVPRQLLVLNSYRFRGVCMRSSLLPGSPRYLLTAWRRHLLAACQLGGPYGSGLSGPPGFPDNPGELVVPGR